MTRLVLAAASALVLGACAHQGPHDHHAHHNRQGHSAAMMHAPMDGPSSDVKEPAKAAATIIGSEGVEIGWATFEQGPIGVLIRMEIGAGGLTPGWHGLHLHEIGDCSDVGAFQLSGGHHGKEEGAHGLMNPDKGPEPGDLPNLWAAADGSAGYEAFTLLTDLAPALGGDGLSIIVHANEDDHRSQPIGGAGPRVACGVVTRTED
ncbi:MAG TPA: superoxide dismutase family protein [Hyphomonas sp.]|nr:superoxide dismutase family protein [Hyphomonas sp.]HRK69263.1 superoxide dismutase family protein [Hyphomonas sp.]